MRVPKLTRLSRLTARGLRKRPFGLWQKFLLAFTALVVGLIICLLLIVENRQRASIIHQVKKRGITMATQLAAVSTRSLLTYDFVLLEQDTEKVSRNQDVLHVIILDREGQVAAYSGHDAQQGKVLQDDISQRAEQAQKLLIQEVKGEQGKVAYYDIAVPVFIQASKDKWGTVRVGLSLNDMWAEIRRTRRQVLQLGVVGVVLGTVAAAFLARRIAAPIQDLTAGTIAVAHGDLQHVIPIRTRDEIAVLATNFNHMTAQLLKHRMALEAANRELDDKVHELSILANYNENILTSMSSGLFTLDLDGRFETFNAMAETILDLCGTEVRGQPYQHILAAHTPLVQMIDTSYRRHTPLTVPRLELDRPDGQRLPLGLRTATLQDHDGSTVGLLAIFEDLSPMQMLKHRLRRADRLATLGHVAAGLAHEIKNPLTSVRAFVQLVRQKHDDSHFIEQFDRVVLHEVDRINAIVEELLDLTRPAPLHRVPLDVLAILQRVTDTYTEPMRQQQIHMETAWPDTLPPLEADAEQLQRAFGNITLNAIEAMSDGGTLRIACHAVPRSLDDIMSSGYPEPLGSSQVEPDDHYTTDIAIAFCDTGAGIPAEQLDNLFTPFFTTKRRGTG